MENLNKNAYVEVYYGKRRCLMPLDDYFDRRAYDYGFDSYEDLKKAGYSIDMPDLVDEDGNPL